MFPAHNLRTETGRYAVKRVSRNERICEHCDPHLIEDE